MEGYRNFTFDDIEDIFKRSEVKIPEADLEIGESYIEELCRERPETEEQYLKLIRQLNKKHRKNFRKSELLRIYYMCIEQRPEFFGSTPDPHILKLLQKVKARSQSGVLVVTVFTGPSSFSCPENCHYCPLEVDENGKQTQPRSYRSEEPGNMRATENGFDPVRQFFARVRQLETCGHPVDKCEILVLGGTWSFYPVGYQEYFITSLYYAANIYLDWRQQREMLSLEEEQRINETSRCRIIGITLETRPDCIIGENKATNRHYKKQSRDIDPLSEIRRFRRYGVTRVQIGIQHIRDDILKYINRNCTNDQNIRAIKMLKENGFKVDIHIMLDLPGASPEIDMDMLLVIITSPYFVVDYWKLYPTATMDFTEIKKWREQGKYLPYAEEENGRRLNEVMAFAMEKCPVYTRINRVFRDFPLKIINGGCQVPNLRQVIDKQLEQDPNKSRSRNIRDREIKNQSLDPENAELVERRVESSDGVDYFLSFEDVDHDVLYGFIRLRFNDSSESAAKLRLPLFESSKVALIRELHVYGNLTKVTRKNKQAPDAGDNNAQHQGFGKRLLQRAEEIARDAEYDKVAIISGVGVREYYRRRGYHLEDTYMVKDLAVEDYDMSIRGFDPFRLFYAFLGWFWFLLNFLVETCYPTTKRNASNR
jgi:elongator complex protein 3